MPAKRTKELEAEPTLEEWRALYEAAVAYRDLAPWNWMHEDALFGVENPETGQIGYCCVLGGGSEEFALNVFLGTEGLIGYWKMVLGPPAQETNIEEVLEAQTCITASFQDRATLETRDRATIKELGLRFRGANAWPQFRSFRPGFSPWFVTGAEARFLTVALEQAIEVTPRVRYKPKLLPSPGAGRYLVRTPVRNQAGAIIGWEDRKRLAPAVSSPAPTAAPLDRDRVERARKLPHTRGRVEMDYSRLMAPVGGRNERPYLPRLLLAADSGSGAVLATDMLGPDDDIAVALPGALLNIVEMVKALPGVILVQREEAMVYLKPLAEALEVDLVLESSLPALNTARFELDRFMMPMDL